MELVDQAITDGANEQAVSIQRIDHGDDVYVYDVTYNYIVDQAITDGANEQAVRIQRIGMKMKMITLKIVTLKMIILKITLKMV